MTHHERRFSSASLSDGGFRSLGEFLIAVRRAAVDQLQDRRLLVTRSGANEVDPTAGGFAVPEVYSARVIRSIYESAMLAPLCDVTETGSPLASFKEPAIDETSRQDGARWGGMVSYWEAEAEQIGASKPRFRLNEFTGHKLTQLCYVTNELFRDSALLESHFERAMAEEGSFKLDAAILKGTGAGVPLGILNSPCLITVNPAAGQAPGTITGANVEEMWKRTPIPCRRRAVWLVNEDAEEQLSGIGAAVGETSAMAATYIPQGAAGGNPYPLLKGRPVFAIEQAPQLGTPGDVVLADLQSYRVIQGAPRFAMSADVAFLTDEMAFRFTFRVDGKPSYLTPITPYNGSQTRSPFVTLGAR